MTGSCMQLLLTPLAEPDPVQQDSKSGALHKRGAATQDNWCRQLCWNKNISPTGLKPSRGQVACAVDLAFEVVSKLRGFQNMTHLRCRLPCQCSECRSSRRQRCQAWRIAVADSWVQTPRTDPAGTTITSAQESQQTPQYDSSHHCSRTAAISAAEQQSAKYRPCYRSWPHLNVANSLIVDHVAKSTGSSGQLYISCTMR